MENADTQKIIELLEEFGRVQGEHTKKFEEHDELLHFVCETIGTLATKQEMKGEFADVHNQLSGIKVELAGIRKELDDIKLSLNKLEDKTQEDDDVVISEIEKLKQRVAVLERQLKMQMQVA